MDSSIFVHLQNANSALDIWSTLRRLFEDKGLSRKIGLLRKLISIRLDECEGMQQYVDQIVNTSNKLSGIGFAIDDEWIGAILLAGLTDSYQPLIMGIESSGTKISGDSIISKLLDNRIEAKSKDSAFLEKKNKKKQQCRYCDKDWDKKHRCLNKNKKNAEKNDSNKKPAAFLALMTHEIQADPISTKKNNEKKLKHSTSEHTAS